LDSYGDWKQLSSYLSQSAIERLGMRRIPCFFALIVGNSRMITCLMKSVNGEETITFD